MQKHSTDARRVSRCNVFVRAVSHVPRANLHFVNEAVVFVCGLFMLIGYASQSLATPVQQTSHSVARVQSDRDRPPNNALRSYPVVSGIGVALTVTGAGTQVFKVFPNSAAARSGNIHHGDVILDVYNGARTIPLKGKSLAEVVNLIRGPVGTSIRLLVKQRNGKKSTVTLTRESVPLPVPSYQHLVGTYVANVSLTTLQLSHVEKLSTFKGKIVVLDLWAPWCGACYEPLSRLQRIVGAHPDWNNRVAVLAASIHSSKSSDLSAIHRMKWNNIHFFSLSLPTMKAMGVEVIPTQLVLSPTGKIVAIGDPHAMSLVPIISELLTHYRHTLSERRSGR